MLILPHQPIKTCGYGKTLNNVASYLKEDRSFTKQMSDLIWQNDPYMSAQRKVNTTLCNEYNAQQRLITTHDNQDIATLIRYAPNAHVTIVYVTGYFAHKLLKRMVCTILRHL